MIDTKRKQEKKQEKEKVRKRMRVEIDPENYEYIPAKKPIGFRQRIRRPASNADGSRLRRKSGTLQRTRLATSNATTMMKNWMSHDHAERVANEDIYLLFSLFVKTLPINNATKLFHYSIKSKFSSIQITERPENQIIRQTDKIYHNQSDRRH